MNFQLAQIISILVGGVLPLVTGFVTKSTVSPGFRAVVLLVLSGATAVLTDFLGSLNGGTAFDWGTALVAALLTFLTGVGMHFGLWNPTGAAAKAKAKFRPVPTKPTGLPLA
jgi:VIT1/CCC1 family predicted Fe2+/Mn2+ transporter